jgi:hypothetical protein
VDPDPVIIFNADPDQDPDPGSKTHDKIMKFLAFSYIFFIVARAGDPDPHGSAFNICRSGYGYYFQCGSGSGSRKQNS